jgi:Carboxypeptidase regulatory-like domain
VKRSPFAGRTALIIAMTVPVVAMHAQGSNPPPVPPTVPAPQGGIEVRARILGVFDEQTGEPIAGAEVSDVRAGVSALTTSTGTVALSFLPEGISFVRIRKVGYAAQTFPVMVSVTDTASITVVLARSATTLSTVVTRDSAPHYLSARLNAFEARRRQGMGDFITEADLRKGEGRPLANILVGRIPGVAVRDVRSRSLGRITLLSRTRGGRICYPDIYLDGVRMVRAGGGVGADLGQVEASSLGAVEFHETGDMPPEFNSTGADCGALLLWTRDR